MNALDELIMAEHVMDIIRFKKLLAIVKCMREGLDDITEGSHLPAITRAQQTLTECERLACNERLAGEE